jgi:hypothetical protein
MRLSGTEKIGGGSRLENKLDFIGEYPELSLPLSGAFPWATRLLKLLCCQWEIPDRQEIVLPTLTHTWGRLANQEVFGYS